MEHYITEINIEKLRHLSNIVISLNPEQRQHLIVTGKNGSGKTSLLVALQKYLRAINEDKFNYLMEDCIPGLQRAKEKLNKAKTEKEKYEIKTKPSYEYYIKVIKQYADGVKILLNNCEYLESLYSRGDFITAYFPASRKIQIVRAQGVEDIKLSEAYAVNSQPGQLLHKYMVHLKTQQAYARNEGDLVTVDRIQRWFDRLVGALQILLDDDSIELEYDYKEYDFKIHASGRNPFGLDELSDGYSSVVQIVSDLILRMDKNWLLGDRISQYDIEGIVLIDEIETHLHIALQKKIMPFLTEFFPRIQFIVTTHSPYILSSLTNAKVYDLENCVELEDLSAYSADALAESYFGTDEYSDKLKEKLRKYKELKEKQNLTDVEHAERAKLRYEFQNIPKGMSLEIVDMFHDIEGI